MTANYLLSDELKALQAEVERCVRCSMTTPADFLHLSKIIYANTHLAVSPTTLKRVWGYQKDTADTYHPSNYTLRALSRLVGFREFDEFCLRGSRPEEPVSANYYGAMIESAELPKNALVSIRWSPDRVCLLKHIFDSHFEVIEARNSKILAGDIVTCSVFVQHAPLYFQSVHREGVPSMTYVAGMPGGVEYEVVVR